MGRLNGLFLLVIAAFVYVVGIPNSGRARADKSVIAWAEKIDAELPMGFPHEEFINWAEDNELSVDFPEDRHISLTVDKVSGWGIPGLLCADWKIAVDITFAPEDGIMDKTVHKISRCDE